MKLSFGRSAWSDPRGRLVSSLLVGCFCIENISTVKEAYSLMMDYPPIESAFADAVEGKISEVSIDYPLSFDGIPRAHVRGDIVKASAKNDFDLCLVVSDEGNEVIDNVRVAAKNIDAKVVATSLKSDSDYSSSLLYLWADNCDAYDFVSLRN